MPETPQYEHFKGKGAIEHIATVQAEGRLTSTESHGTELPGYLSAATDSARDMAIALLLIWIILSHLQLSIPSTLLFLGIFGIGWLVWKSGRSAWMGWSRLERLHRVLKQEKWEIEHNRPQEKEELTALYAAKGFEGKLLEDVIEVLMADGDRLLRVMIEEELGLSLETHDHPLKQSLGAAAGAFIALVTCFGCVLLFPCCGMIAAAMLIVAASAIISSYHIQNKIIPAVVWNLGLTALSAGFVFFLFEYFDVKS